MAWIRVTFFKPIRRTVGAVISLKNAVAEAIESTSSSQVSTNECPFNRDGVLRVHAGGDIWLNIGPNPVAAEGVGIFMADGEVADFAVSYGDNIAVIDA